MRDSRIISIFLILVCINNTSLGQTNLTEDSFFTCCDTLKAFPDIGDYCNLDKSKKNFLLVNSSQILPAKCFIVQKTKFKVAVGIDNKITYIMTTDSIFKTPENITTNNTLKELINLFGDKLYAQPGFGWIFNLPSGWDACFIESEDSFGITRPAINKKINWISKSD
jgi:hypothetical protein